MEEITKKRICIIGAGAAGLVAIHHISQSPSLTGIVFEASGDLGGVWNYRPKSISGNTPNGTLYKNMKTNQPKQLMGFPFSLYPDAFSTNPDQTSTAYLHHTEVREFLRSFAQHFEIRKYIRFNRRVVEVRPIINNEYKVQESFLPKWRVTVEHVNIDMDREKAVSEEFEFDAVVICNGHLSRPLMPEIKNLEVFQGTVLHSKDYDEPEPFAGKSVLIVGCGPSGVDISLEVAEVASIVILSNVKEAQKFALPKNMIKVPRIISATPQGFVCSGGEKVKCDAVIMCTGYVFDFPFLSPECGVVVKKNQRISPLYQDLIHIQYPNLCFVGIQNLVNAFTLFDFQVRYCVKLFEGHFKLPMKEEMLAKMEKEREVTKSILSPPPTASLNWSHQLGTRQWQYYEGLAKEANFDIPQFLPLFEKIYAKVRHRRENNARAYKLDKIYITNLVTNSFCYVEAPDPTD